VITLFGKLDAGELEILRSAKLVGTLKQLRLWLQDHPDDKIIVFTQWKPSTTMLGTLIEEKMADVNFVYFTVSLMLC